MKGTHQAHGGRDVRARSEARRPCLEAQPPAAARTMDGKTALSSATVVAGRRDSLTAPPTTGDGDRALAVAITRSSRRVRFCPSSVVSPSPARALTLISGPRAGRRRRHASASGLEHDVVGDIDDVVDRANAGASRSASHAGDGARHSLAMASA